MNDAQCGDRKPKAEGDETGDSWVNLYLQYHNCDQEGLPHSDLPFSEARLGIHTRRSHVQTAQGKVFLIAGIGKPRHYFLWECFQIDAVQTNQDGEYEASGPGWQLAPPQELLGKAFDEFKASCANFVGFRRINDLPYVRTLNHLAELHRPPGEPDKIAGFLKNLLTLAPQDRIALEKALAKYGTRMKALSIRQPHADAIMRGIKRVEYRTRPTNVRGRVLIYASLGRYPVTEEAEMMKMYGMDDSCADLPRGVLLGTVELYDCKGGEWFVRKPERADKLLMPKRQPQPVWFYPF